MPCYMTGSAEGDARLGEQEARQEAGAATRAACDMWRVLKEKGLVGLLASPTRMWGRKHDEIDAKREARSLREQKAQKMKKAALGKLTRKEREALGL